ncbi:hypothetical protein [Pseudogemmobacter sp. W21_MBD1_M6]|uniref:hypothetical protein n=1 Tax=Pseudogemmobacter sp. W21_MBD1_M6 TaxID=3240271 RepID=UPI003F94D778
MSFEFSASVAALAILIATGCAAQTATDTMSITIDGAEIVLPVSATYDRAKSEWRGDSGAKGFDQLNVTGFLLKDNAIDMRVDVSFGVLAINGQQLITDTGIMLTERGTEGGWMADGREEAPVITLTTYEKSDAGMLVEGTFSGTTDYRVTLYKTPKEPEEIRTMTGHFSIFYPAR